MKPSFRGRSATWHQDRDALRSVRIPVFVVEQSVDPNEEFDEVDLVCRHFLATDAKGCAIGTGRLDDHGKIGRMAVAKEWRGRGVGRAILGAAVAAASQQGMRRVYLHAQVSALGFYERQGFRAFGECFSEAGIEHLAMDKDL